MIESKLGWNKISSGQKVRIACATLGMAGVAFAVAFVRVLGDVTTLLFGREVVLNFDPTPTWENTLVFAFPCVMLLGIVWLCAHYIKKNDAPRPDGWGVPIIEKSEAAKHPDLLWAIGRIWESDYVREGQTIYFTTIRDILAAGGMNVNSTQIRSVLEMAGCDVSRDAVRESELAGLYRDRKSDDAVQEVGEEPNT